jgi:CheY-like chemotaxis protein
MNRKNQKAVLIVDDEQRMCESLKDRFTDCNDKLDCPYEFEVDIVLSADECRQKVLTKSYDVIVLDVVLDIRVKGKTGEETSGLDAALALALYEQQGWETPIRIIFTGYPSYEQCVKAMRHGA